MLLKRDSRTSFFVWIMRNCSEQWVYRTPTSDMTLFFTFLETNEVCNLKTIYLVEDCSIWKRKSQSYSILCGYGKQAKISLPWRLISQKLLLLYIIVSFWPILWPWSHILKQQQIRFNYIKEINIKGDAKKMKDYNISKIIIVLYYCKFSANSLAMITHIKTTTKKI